MLKVAIIGCGLISLKKHIPAFIRLKNVVNVVAVCDLDEALAKNAADKYKIKNYYTDFTKMLSEQQPDIVDICTPPQTHAKIAIEALNSGSHVIIEKPMSLCVADCDLMIEAANRNKKELGIIHNQIFNPAFTKGKEMLLKDEVGDFIGLHIFLSTPTNYITSNKDHWAHKLPGGILGETGPHSVYLALAFLKNVRDVNINAKKLLPNYTWSNSEDFRFSLIADNGIASVIQTYGSNQWVANVDIFGSRGILKIDLQSQIVIKYNRSKLKVIPLGLSMLEDLNQSALGLFSNSLSYLLGNKKDGHTVAIRNFVDSVLHDSSFSVTGVEGRMTVKIMETLVTKFNANLSKIS